MADSSTKSGCRRAGRQAGGTEANHCNMALTTGDAPLPSHRLSTHHHLAVPEDGGRRPFPPIAYQPTTIWPSPRMVTDVLDCEPVMKNVAPSGL